MLRVSNRHSEGLRCPLCHDPLAEGEARDCLGCGTSFHEACLLELGGCSTLGCNVQGELPASAQHWFCRTCHQPILSDLTRRRCPCGAYLHDECVEDHLGVCERAAQLRRRDGWEPAERPKLDMSPRAGASLPTTIYVVWFVGSILALAFVHQVLGGSHPLYEFLDSAIWPANVVALLVLVGFELALSERR